MASSVRSVSRSRTVTVRRPSGPLATAGGSSLSNLRNTDPRSRASVYSGSNLP